MMSGKLNKTYKQTKPFSKHKKASTRNRAREEPVEPSLGVHGDAAVTEVDLDEDDRILRQFDLSSKYGPCIGISRLERWQRAEKFGLHPPVTVKQILDRKAGSSDDNRCLWEGRIWSLNNLYEHAWMSYQLGGSL